MKLARPFFEQKTLTVARELLGCFLIRRLGRGMMRAQIIETEAYGGLKDKASHAHRGRTKRNEAMFGPAGRAYVYLIYGKYYCFNVVTEKKSSPAAVLIRGVKIDGQKIIGPGRVCRALSINAGLNNLDLLNHHELWLERGALVRPKIKKMPRVGIDYAEEYKNKLWRFLLAD